MNLNELINNMNEEFEQIPFSSYYLEYQMLAKKSEHSEEEKKYFKKIVSQINQDVEILDYCINLLKEELND